MKVTKTMYLNASIIIVILIMVVIMIYRAIPRDHEIYCYTEYYDNITDVKANKCMKYKIVTSDLNVINWSWDHQCADSLTKLPECQGEMYYSRYALQDFCLNCSITGNICIGYWIEYLEYNNHSKRIYEDQFWMRWNDSSYNLDRGIEICSGEAYAERIDDELYLLGERNE